MAKPICGGCREREARIAALERRVADLEARLGQNSRNSSLPSSANPLAAPKPVVKAPTGRKPGAQPGHDPSRRIRLPALRHGDPTTDPRRHPRPRARPTADRGPGLRHRQ